MLLNVYPIGCRHRRVAAASEMRRDTGHIPNIHTILVTYRVDRSQHAIELGLGFGLGLGLGLGVIHKVDRSRHA